MNSPLDQDAVRRLYEAHARGLLAYACSYVSSFAAAEDIVHQVFERLLRGDLSITNAPVSYLYRAVRNASLNGIRDRAREADFDEGWLEAPSGMEHAALELQSALRELPEEQREVILLHVWAQMTFEAIAGALSISPNTAASRYRYALSKLREQFQVTERRRRGQPG